MNATLYFCETLIIGLIIIRALENSGEKENSFKEFFRTIVLKKREIYEKY